MLPFQCQSDPSLSFTYSYMDDPYHTPDTTLSFTPISQQLVYPTTRRTDPIPPLQHAVDGAPPSMLDYYAATSQPLFPTPSELLSNISLSHPQPSSCQRDVPEPRPYLQPSSPPPPSQTSVEDPPIAAVNKTESQRKARQRAIAEEIGFTPTDPDTISSHEKKRHYLECLEQYVLYLHDQLRLVEAAPLALERVSTYRGLSSRSIRTLLVHMQNTNKTLHEGTLVEEQVFLDLSTQVMAAHTAGLPLRRHSVDVGGVSKNPAGYHSGLTPFDISPDDTTASASPSSVDGNSASPDPPTELSRNIPFLG